MSKLNRLIGMASKALGDKTASGSNGANGSDWRSVVRGAADALTGDARQPGHTPPTPQRRTAAGAGATDADRAAIARYDYLMKTADPDQIERIHRDAFARLTRAQRAEVEQRVAGDLPPHERPRSAEPEQLARAATRAEMMRPGALRGALGRSGALAGVGIAAAGGLLAAVAGGAVVSAVAAPLLEQASGLVDFDAIASGIDPETLVSSLDAEALAGGFGDQVSGAAEHVSGFGEQLSNFELPNLGDLFGR